MLPPPMIRRAATPPTIAHHLSAQVLEYEDNPARRIFRLPSCAPLMDEISDHIERFCVEVLTSMEHDINERNMRARNEGASQLGKHLIDREDADKPVVVKKKARRSRLPHEAVAILQEWFDSHLNHPYPTDDEKKLMAAQCNISLNQVVNWFTNTRKRVWIPYRRSKQD